MAIADFSRVAGVTLAWLTDETQPSEYMPTADELREHDAAIIRYYRLRERFARETPRQLVQLEFRFEK